MKGIFSLIILSIFSLFSVLYVSAQEGSDNRGGKDGSYSKSKSSMNHSGAMYNSGTALTPEQLSCVRVATAEREAALIQAIHGNHNSMMTAHSGRTLALDAAWQLTDSNARREAINNAWKMWKQSNHDAQKLHKKVQKDVWKNFKEDIKTCGVSGKSTDAHASMWDSMQ